MAALPLNFTDALPDNDEAWAFRDLVAEMDLSEFEAFYRADGKGRPPYAPGSMVALLLYCHARRITSARDIERACRVDVGARMIMANQCPERSTIDRFRREHVARLVRLFPQTLALGAVEGLVDLSVVAGDGTKVVANAALGATVTERALRTEIAALDERRAQAVQAWQRAVGIGADAPECLVEPGVDREVPPAGGGPVGDEQVRAWREVGRVEGMLRRRQAALTHLLEHPGSAVTDWQDRLDRDQARVRACEQRLVAGRAERTAAAAARQAILATGRKIPGTRSVPVEDSIVVRRLRRALDTARTRAQATAGQRPDESKVNTTDPQSRIMPGKHDGFDQRYNLQALACGKQFIVAVGLHDNPNDKQAMTDLLRQGRDNLDAAGIHEQIRVALFDSGYASEANITADVPVDLLLVAVEKECRQTGRLTDETSTAHAAWKTMADRLNEPENRAHYKRRAALVEPLFAQLFARFGRTLHHRGPAVLAEVFLWAISHNCLKIHRQRVAAT